MCACVCVCERFHVCACVRVCVCVCCAHIRKTSPNAVNRYVAQQTLPQTSTRPNKPFHRLLHVPTNISTDFYTSQQTFPQTSTSPNKPFHRLLHVPTSLSTDFYTSQQTFLAFHRHSYQGGVYRVCHSLQMQHPHLQAQISMVAVSH